MIRLHHVFGAQTGRSQEIDRPVIRCGRLPDNDVAFDPHADIDASGRHAEIRNEEGGYSIVDVGSRNGTMVNGQRVHRQELRDGDVIEFGKGGPRLRVEIVQSPPAALHATQLAATEPPPASAASAKVIIHPPSSGERQSAAQGFAHHEGDPRPATPSAAPGKQTVAMMIAAALKGQGKSTTEINAITEAAVRRSSRRLKMALGAVTVLLMLALVSGAIAFFVQQSDVTTTRDELRSAYDRLEQLNQTGAVTRAQDTAEKIALQERIREMSKRLDDNLRGPAARIAQENQQAVFMLAAVRPGSSEELGFCTAFAVGQNLLATNAHCVVDMERQQQSRSARFVAMPNSGGGGRFEVTWMARHPAFQPAGQHPSPDCGLVQISGAAPHTVRLAAPEGLARLQPGDPIYVYGFPGNLMEARSPVATITTGVVGRITSFEGLAAPFQSSLLIQHSAFTSPGTSGSPIFANDGSVIGVNTGAFRRLSEQTVVDPETGRRGSILMTQDLSGYAFGVRSDLVQSLLMGLQAMPGGPLR